MRCNIYMDLHMHTLTSNVPTSRACTMSLVHTREKPKRGHNPQPVTAKCCRALLLSDKMEINYTTHPLFFRLLFKIIKLEIINRYLVHIIVLHVTQLKSERCTVSNLRLQFWAVHISLCTYFSESCITGKSAIEC